MRSSNGRSDCGEGSSNGEDGEDVVETARVGVNEEGGSEDDVGRDARDRDGVRENGDGGDEVNANEEMSSLPRESKKRMVTQIKINTCFFKILKYRERKCVIKENTLKKEL
nr:hypothetical protein [Bartonella bovis]